MTTKKRSEEKLCRSSLELSHTVRLESGAKYRFRTVRDYEFSGPPPKLEEQTLQKLVANELFDLKEKLENVLIGEENTDLFELKVIFKDNFEHGKKVWSIGPFECELPGNKHDKNRVERMVMAANNTLAEEIRRGRFTREIALDSA